MRNALLGLCAVAVCAVLWSMIRHVTANLEMLRNWKRIAGVVTGTAERDRVEVTVGALEAGDRIEVPVDPASMYSNWNHVTVLENPSNPEQRRLTGIFDLWYPVLTRLLLIVLLAATGVAVWNTQIGFHQVWSKGEWIPADDAPSQSATPPFAEVRPPGSAWKANLLWGAVLGGSLLAGSILLGDSSQQLTRLLTGWLGAMFLLWMAWQSIANYTHVLKADNSGIESASKWGTKRAAWSDIASVTLVDTGAELEKLKGLGARGKMKPADNAVPDIRHWIFADNEGREIFRMDRESIPAAHVDKLLDKARENVRRQ